MLLFKYDAPFIEDGAYIEIHSEIHAEKHPDHPSRVETPFTSAIFNKDGVGDDIQFHETLQDAVRNALYDIVWCCRHTGDPRFSKLVTRTEESQAESDLTIDDFKLAE